MVFEIGANVNHNSMNYTNETVIYNGQIKTVYKEPGRYGREYILASDGKTPIYDFRYSLENPALKKFEQMQAEFTSKFKTAKEKYSSCFQEYKDAHKAYRNYGEKKYHTHIELGTLLSNNNCSNAEDVKGSDHDKAIKLDADERNYAHQKFQTNTYIGILNHRLDSLRTTISQNSWFNIVAEKMKNLSA